MLQWQEAVLYEMMDCVVVVRHKLREIIVSIVLSANQKKTSFRGCMSVQKCTTVKELDIRIA